jgi:DUF4097 and DUF4098 domain-containing protein YvlB
MKRFPSTNLPGMVLLTGILLMNGCVFNANRISVQKTGEVPSTGLNGIVADLSDYSGNVTVTGTAEKRVKATVAVSDIATTATGESNLDQMTVDVTTHDSVGTVGISFAGTMDQWELIRVEDISVSCDKALDVTAKAVSGNIEASGIEGFMDLETVSGNVNAEAVSNCSLTVTSGNIELTLDPDTAIFTRAVCKTTSGNITVTVPDNFRADLDLTVTSGNINTPGSSKTRLNGGNPAVHIICTTTSGNITISEQ